MSGENLFDLRGDLGRLPADAFLVEVYVVPMKFRMSIHENIKVVHWNVLKGNAFQGHRVALDYAIIGRRRGARDGQDG